MPGGRPFSDPAPWSEQAHHWSKAGFRDLLCWYAPELVIQKSHPEAWSLEEMTIACETGEYSLRAMKTPNKPIPRNLPVCFRVRNRGELDEAFLVIKQMRPSVPFCFFIPPTEVGDVATRAALVDDMKRLLQLHGGPFAREAEV